MKRKSIAGPVVAITLGGAFVLFALIGVLRAVIVASDPYADSASAAGTYSGVVIWGVLGAVALTLGIRAVVKTGRENAALRQQAPTPGA
ncbi:MULTISPECIES: hypothetical protein [unclassified Curtobacterium]|uniref:hypothetical protein n=1 Tax=unclassified Curtobacterium TaxID=257496 RepID=UPI003A805C79